MSSKAKKYNPKYPSSEEESDSPPQRVISKKVSDKSVLSKNTKKSKLHLTIKPRITTKVKKIVPMKKESFSEDSLSDESCSEEDFPYKDKIFFEESDRRQKPYMYKGKKCGQEMSAYRSVHAMMKILHNFEIPECVNEDQHDIIEMVLKLFKNCAVESFTDIKIYTEEVLYYMAVISYFTNFTLLLQNLYKYFYPNGIASNDVSFTDKHYWLYLAHEDRFFYCTMEIEMFRRRTTSKICGDGLIDITKNKRHNYLNIEKIRPFEALAYDMHQSMVRYRNSMDMCNTNTGNVKQNVEWYPSISRKNCLKILEIGGIIAGGYANSLYNPCYFTLKVDIESILDHLHEEDDKFYGSLQYDECIQVGYTAFQKKDESRKLRFIQGLPKFIKMFYAFNPPPDMTIPEWEDFLRYAMKHYQDYDLYSEYQRLKKCFCIIDGLIHLIYFNYASDVDIFLTGENYLDKANLICDYLYKNNPEKVYVSEFAISFSYYCGPSFQIIKRKYPGVEAILCGFDIDPSRVAMIYDKKSELGFKLVATKSYLAAVKTGTNLIVPCRQSQTFNYRLVKYEGKGYKIYIPMLHREVTTEGYALDNVDPAIIQKMKRTALSDDETACLKSGISAKRNTVCELQAISLFPHNYDWKEKASISDYDAYTAEYITQDIKNGYTRNEKITSDVNQGVLNACQRAALIVKEQLAPTMKDIVFVANKVLYYISLFCKENKKDEEDNRKKYKKLGAKVLRYCVGMYWLDIDPTTQFTGSFNPTNMDYLAGKHNDEKKKENKLLYSSEILVNKLLIQKFGTDVGKIISEYRNLDILGVFFKILELGVSKEELLISKSLKEEGIIPGT